MMQSPMQRPRKRCLEAADWIVAGGLALVAGLLYWACLADYAFPGESARLAVLWRGLDPAPGTDSPYPLCAFFTRLFGGGNALAPLCGALTTGIAYVLAAFFVRLRTTSEYTQPFVRGAGRLAGVVTAVVFALSGPALSSATHLEPRLFAVAWAMLACLLAVPWRAVTGRFAASVFPLLIGALWGLGFCDHPFFWAALPFAGLLIFAVPRAREENPVASFGLAFAGFAIAFFAFAACNGGIAGTVSSVWSRFTDLFARDRWILVAGFSTLPFAVMLFSSSKAFNEPTEWMSLTFHAALAIASVLAVATPLSAASLMAAYAVLPVAATLFAAATAGYLAAWCWLLLRAPVRQGDIREISAFSRHGRPLALAIGGMLALVWLCASAFSVFSFDAKAGAFADRMAEKIIDDLGSRTWFVTDGVLDNHLMLVAAKQKRPLDLIALNRDSDPEYLDVLEKTVVERKLGGAKFRDVAAAVPLGVLPFVQDWLEADPSAAKSVAVFGAPDLWYGARLKPCPEFAFFGGDTNALRDVSADWAAFRDVLKAPKDWGSYRLWKEEDPVTRMRLYLRRHLGLLAVDRGVWLQDWGRDDEAFEMYERVLNEIDRDNVCALFNLFELVRAGNAKAVAKKNEYERRIKLIIADPDRRYRLWSLSNYYGYIRNPELLIELGHGWARSGMPGVALQQIRRATDLVPTEKRSALMNMIAALYARDELRNESRSTYERVLVERGEDHDALVGLMRLALQDGDIAKAREFLGRAVAAAGDDPRADVERAMLAFMKNDLPAARTLLRKITDAQEKALDAWSLLAGVLMQMSDAEKDPAKRKALETELERGVLPSMEKAAANPLDYNVQMTKGFLLLRKGPENRKAARDCFAVAVKSRPDMAHARDILLGLDIQLNDPAAAEVHARNALRLNRRSPLANYALGSIALGRGEMDMAEAYLRRAADAPKPVALALNDLAELLRRKQQYPEAERYARLATKTAPELYVAWETLASVLMGAKGDLGEAEKCIQKAIDLSKDEKGQAVDARMFVSLARVQLHKGEPGKARMTLRRVQSRLGELTDFEKRECDALAIELKSAK